MINKETINELANISNKISENITSDDFDDTLSKETINEIESIISVKKIERQKFILNAERARRASANLTTKATKLDSEINEYESRLRNISQQSVSNY